MFMLLCPRNSIIEKYGDLARAVFAGNWGGAAYNSDNLFAGERPAVAKKPAAGASKR